MPRRVYSGPHSVSAGGESARPPGADTRRPSPPPPWRGSSFFCGRVDGRVYGRVYGRIDGRIDGRLFVQREGLVATLDPRAVIPRPGFIHSRDAADWCARGRHVTVGRVTANVPVVLTVVADDDLSDSTDRVAAAVGLRAVRAQTPSRKNWTMPAAVVVDEDGARRCVRAGMPRRDGVLVVGTDEPAPSIWLAALEVGAQHLCVLPAQEAELVRYLSEAAELGRAAPRRGRVIAVTAGRGGGGASVFAAALAQCAGEALLVDLDPYGGGVDLLLGVESEPGLRWPELAAASGRLSWNAVREVLPRQREVSLLSCSRMYHEIDAGAATTVVDAGRRGGVTVVCDMPRSLTASVLCVLESADLVVIVTSCDVRAAASSAAVVGVIRTVNPNIGLVVRGPAPGGLRAGEVVDVAAVPLLAAMRPEPLLDQQLEKQGLRLQRRSPLTVAARKVLGVLQYGAENPAA